MVNDHVTELDRNLERDKAEREKRRQAIAVNAKRRAAIDAQGRRLRDTFEAVYAWPGQARARGEKPSPQGFFAWAGTWVELGISLQSLASMHQRLEFALERVQAGGPSELEYAARMLLLAMDGSQQQIAKALEKVHSDPGAQRSILWLPWICDCLWWPEAGGCADLPDGITRQDMEKAEAAFGGGPISKDEIGEPIPYPPRDAAQLRTLIEQRFVTVRMTGMALAGRASGASVREICEFGRDLKLRGFPAEPEKPPGGWTGDTERIALDKFRHWLDEYLCTNPGAHTAEESRADATIWYHGERSYSTDGTTPVVVTNEQHNFLTAFLDKDAALDTAALTKAGVSNVSRVTKALQKRFPIALRKPTAKGEGYYIRVRSRVATK